MSIPRYLRLDLLTSLGSWLTGINRYHQLNHHAIFGAGYGSSAMSSMQRLLKKYGNN